MKVFKFFILRLFFKKAIFAIAIILLLFIANYTTFTVVRSILLTFQGYQEIKCINQEGNYIANLDPDSDVDMDGIEKNEIQAVYDYLNNHFNYAFFTDGFMVSLPNSADMEISLAYMNEKYYELNHWKLSQGTDLTFNYPFDKNKEIPVLIGKGLSKTYPIGSTIKMEDPVLEQTITLKVQGVLKQNACHSNYYAPNSKNYYNFTIILPVNEDFLKNADIDLPLNALMDIVILQTTKEKTVKLSEFMQDNLGLKFNFFSQEENWDYFNEYYLYSLEIMSITTLVLLTMITCISIWNALSGIRVMLKEFTIHLLVGLSYSKLRKIFYGYFGILFFTNLIVIFTITAYSRYKCWLRKDTVFVTYGLLGLTGMDWVALFVVFISDLIIGKIIVESMLRKIKKIPVYLGVLQ